MSQKRGPKTPLSDEALLEAIRRTVAESPFRTEGHRKVLARLRRLGIKTSKKRVLRLMRQAGLLQSRPVKTGKEKDIVPTGGRHIITDCPNLIWGMDSTKLEPELLLFAVLEHWNSEVLAWGCASISDSEQCAMEVLRTAIQNSFGSLADSVATGLSLRLDHWKAHHSTGFLSQMFRWGITPCFIFHRQPQQNGISERFFRTFKEEFGSSTEPASDSSQDRSFMRKFISSYNSHWLLARLGYRSPREWRQMCQEAVTGCTRRI